MEEEYTRRRRRRCLRRGAWGRIELGLEDVTVAHSRVVFDAPSALPLRTDQMLLPDVKPGAQKPTGA
ncbi:MAG: hypothetical protein WDM87_15775 [Terracidiphilus sp.]